MTVADLITKLQDYSQNSEVYLMLESNADAFCPIGDVDHSGEAVWVTGINYSQPMTYNEVTGEE